MRLLLSCRPVGARAAMLYFLINELWKINQVYHYSLKAFVTVFNRAMSIAEKSEDIQERVAHLIKAVTFRVFSYTKRGLFERHKLIFSTQLCMKILGKKGEVRTILLIMQYHR